MTIAQLAGQVRACYACRGMDYVHVLGEANGPPQARVMFIAEAPGRLGAARTGIPLSRDQSGRRFERLLAAAGLRRERVFVTNAVLCNPLDARGRNRSPRRREVASCARWLAAQVVVTLGAVALAALACVAPHDYRLPRDVGMALPWQGRCLVPLYHPSPRTGRYRPPAQQEEDFRRLGDLLWSLAPEKDAWPFERKSALDRPEGLSLRYP